jgi:hypothetical protein
MTQFPIGARFKRVPRSIYGSNSGVIIDPATYSTGYTSVEPGSGEFRLRGYRFVAVKWDGQGGKGSIDAAHCVVDAPTPEQIRQQAEALLDKAGFTLIAIDKVANATKLSFNEGVLRLAGIHGKEVEFRYTKTDTAPVETRRLLVESVEKHGDVVLVGGSDPDRGSYRNFRLDRIKGEVKFA